MSMATSISIGFALWGAIILGYADPVVDGAVKKQIDLGSLHSMNSALEIELADELINTIPSAEMVRYTKGGGEACAVAARIARGTTNRDVILFCGYHGWHDWYQSANYLVDPESGEYPFAGIEPDWCAACAGGNGDSIYFMAISTCSGVC